MPPMTATDVRGLVRADFDHIVTLTTRWSDNDAYGHLNNAVYLQLFDTAITGWLNDGVGSLVTTLAAQGVVVESRCRYLRELAYPSDVHAAVGVERLGRTSVTYRLGLFAAERQEIAALGHWVHVYVDPHTRGPVPVPAEVRGMLEAVVAARVARDPQARG
jgi:acyl-CoA thioester hydrolase